MKQDTSFGTGVQWSEQEWVQLAQAWAQDEQRQPEASSADRWKRLVPLVFAPERQRPLPKAKLETRAKRLFELLPEMRQRVNERPPRGRKSSAGPEPQFDNAKAQVSLEASVPPEEVSPPPAVTDASTSAPPEVALSGVQGDTSLEAVEPSSKEGPNEAAEEGTGQEAASASAPEAASEAEPSKRRRVFWTYEERVSFVRTYALLEHEHPLMPASERVKKVQDHLIAMGEMQPHRRRTANPTVLLNSAELLPLLEQARAELKAEFSGQAPAPKLAAVATPLSMSLPVSAPPAAAPSSNPSPAEPPAPSQAAAASALDLLAQAAGAFLRDVLASPQAQSAVHGLIQNSLMPLVRQAVAQAIEEQLGGPSPTAAPASPANGSATAASTPPLGASVPSRPEPKTKVLVVGLLGSQQQDIRADFGSRLDLRFLTQDDSSTRMEQHARNCDLTIGMVGYMGHSAEKHLKKASSDYRRCNGTLGDLRRMLSSLAH